MNLVMAQMGRTGVETGGVEENHAVAQAQAHNLWGKVFKTDLLPGWSRGRESQDLYRFKSWFYYSSVVSSRKRY